MVKLILWSLFFNLLIWNPASAKDILRVDPTGRSGERLEQMLEERPSFSPPGSILPSPPSPKTETGGLPLKSVTIRKIVVTGSTVFSPQQLDEVTSAYRNRELTNEDLEALRRDLSLYYITKGYANSGAVIPDQDLRDGVLRVQIIEGTLTHIEVEGNKWFLDSFIRDRLALGAAPPLNIGPLQQRLQFLQLDNRIEWIHAELRPGVNPGESSLKVRVQEKNPINVRFAFNNYQSPTVGAERGLLTLKHENLSGRGDILNLSYGKSEGLHPQWDLWYALPFTRQDTTVTLRYRRNDFCVVEEPFDDLDIGSQSDVYEITFRHPFYRTLHQEFALALTGEHLKHETFLLDEPFSFSAGAEDGESVITALRFSQEWTHRTLRQVIAARSRFSFGLDALGATVHSGDITDGRFFVWLGQFQWARVLKPWDTQMIFRLDVQLSNDPLLPLEQIAVGGRYSVRGYRENALVRDQAVISSLETRIPLLRDTRWADYVQLVPFVDFGKAWDKGGAHPGPNSLSSVGIGLRWGATLVKHPRELRSQFEIYWGYPLRDVDTPQDDLQDHGIHFEFVLGFF